MSPISDELRQSLIALTHQIEKAEEFLRKQPGSDKAQVLVEEVDGMFDEDYLVAVRDNQGNCRIAVRALAAIESAPKYLEDFPVSVRIGLCKYIDDLLDSAVDCQVSVATDANNAAASIEQALARVSKR
jgi:hypothetical protein